MDNGGDWPDGDDNETSCGDEVTPGVAARVLRRQTSLLKEHLDPDLMCNYMTEQDMLLPIAIRNIREKPSTTDKNGAILQAVEDNIDLYPKFKACIAATGNSYVLQQLENVERDEICLRRKKTGLQPKKRLSARVKGIKEDLLEWYKDKCMWVPLFPGSPEEQYPVEAVYVKPTLKVLESRRRSTEQYCRSYEGCQVDSYCKIFYVDKNMCKNIYLSAEAGFGKTSFCENLVATWCRVHSPSEITALKTVYRRTESHLSDDEQVIAQFDLLFYISLRYANGLATVEEMIEEQLQVELDDEVLESCKCLILLDGLDEWKCPSGQRPSRFQSDGLPRKGNKLAKTSTFLTTSRPWKLEKLRLSTNEVDNHVQICGLSKDVVNDLVGRVIHELNLKYPTDCSAEDFLSEASRRCFDISALCPVVLMFIICLWHEGKLWRKGGDIELSRCEIFSQIIEFLIKKAEQEESDTNTTNSCLPDCFTDCSMCQQHASTLQAVCKLAFCTLLGDKRESELVFSHSVTTVYGMTSSQMDKCLGFGILSQCKRIGRRSSREKLVSFPHKMIQEFLTAVHIVIADEDITEMLSDVNRILELSQVLLFVVQMKPDFAVVLSSLLERHCDQDLRIQEHRLADSYSIMASKNYMLICNIQEFIYECQESILDGHTQMQLFDIVFDKNAQPPNADCFKKLDKSQARSLYMDIPTLDTFSESQHRQITDIIEQTANSSFLERLYIWDPYSSIDQENIKRLLACKTLISIGLRGMDLCGCVNFQNLPGVLRCIRLQEVKLTDDDISEMISFFSSTFNLRKVVLGTLECAGQNNCSLNLDLQGNKNLRHFYIEDMDLHSIRFCDESLEVLQVRYVLSRGGMENILHCLSICGHIKILDIRGFPSEVDTELLVETIRKMNKLKMLTLWQINLADSALVLSENMENLECIRLKYVAFTQDSFVSFVNSIPENTSPIIVQLDEVCIGKSERNADTMANCILNEHRFTITRSLRTFSRNETFSVAFKTKGMSG